ncbi:MAG: class I SAM-dependent methyltransferase [Parachlamydiales bacterium]|jgi:hypothetical protein
MSTILPLERLSPLNTPAAPTEQQGDATRLFTLPDLTPIDSDYRRVFKSNNTLRTEFCNCLKTIFLNLDADKFLALMDEILNDPSKTDAQIYNELLLRIDTTKKNFSFFAMFTSLFALKEGLGKQIAQFMRTFKKEKFDNYLEISSRLYFNTIRKVTHLAFRGTVTALCDNPEQVGLGARLAAESIIYPYTSLPLNSARWNAEKPEPHFTYKPIGDDIPDNSQDMIVCFEGLHHVPPQNLEPFTSSLTAKLRQGGVLLLREHDINPRNVTGSEGTESILTSKEMQSIVSVIHSIGNAAHKISREQEYEEIRDFRSSYQWTDFMKAHGFTRISKEQLVLSGDPSENTLMAFIKTPKSLSDLKQTLTYYNGYGRSKIDAASTFIQQGNARFAEAYTLHIQTQHSYTFDFIGHLKQHYIHFYHFVKECLSDKDTSKIDLLFSGGMAMNLFILTSATLWCSLNMLSSLPSTLCAKWNHGEKWRTVAQLNELEKFQALHEKSYAEFSLAAPYYKYDYISAIKDLWNVVMNSKESLSIRIGSYINAVLSTIALLAKAGISVPLKAFYAMQAKSEPDPLKMIVKDKQKELHDFIETWNKANPHHVVEIVLETKNEMDANEDYKVLNIPHNIPLIPFCNDLMTLNKPKIIEINGQKELYVDVLNNTAINWAPTLYSMKKIDDPKNRSYTTYKIAAANFKALSEVIGKEILYIHE